MKVDTVVKNSAALVPQPLNLDAQLEKYRKIQKAYYVLIPQSLF